MAKLPLPPDPSVLAAITDPEDFVSLSPFTALARIHATTGAHPTAWRELRSYGPLRTARFDPHPDGPACKAPEHAVGYFALSLRTAVAETFQATRVVDRATNGPYLTVLRPVRPLRLLDLSGTWPTRAGASQAINTGRRDRCRAWARTIRQAWPTLDGLSYRSSMDSGAPAVCLWAPATEAIPARFDADISLNHPGIALPLGRAANHLGYLLR